MEKKTITINGALFSGTDGFYEEAYLVLTRDHEWEPAHNPDTLYDMLYGGFGGFEGNEEIVLIRKDFRKSSVVLAGNRTFVITMLVPPP